MEQLLNIKQLSALIGAKRQTIYRWVHEKSIPFLKVGNLVKFRPSAIERWLKFREFELKRNHRKYEDDLS